VGRFLVLYSSPVPTAEMMANTTPEQAQAGMDGWTAWAQKNGNAVVDLGMPLGSSKRIADGSVGNSSSQASGYSIIEADSLDAAASILQDHPHLHTPGGSIDLFEFLAMPGM
jgi:hypothetical protein